MYNNQIKFAIQLEDFMYKDKNKFWNNIKLFLKKNKNSSVSETIPISEFAKYYSYLFSHDDRCSNQKQQNISNEVSR